MKFKKRFLMCLAIVGIILVPSMAKAGDAVAANKWLKKMPTDNGANVLELTATSSRIQRNQTLYFIVADVSGDKTVQQLDPTALASCTTPDTCASAPLFVAAKSLTVCSVGDMEDATAGAGVVDMYICADSSCAIATSAKGGELGAADECSKFFLTGDTAATDGPDVGGSWVYVNVRVGPAGGETLLIWVTAN